jgi:thioredoxin-like negative regulator of GroEL
MSCLEVNNNDELSNFNNQHTKGVWFVWIYAEWCGHCKDVINPWKELENNNKHGVNLAKVNNEYVDGVNSNPSVEGYPTFLLYKNGKVVDVYRGERTSDAFNNYLGQSVTHEDLNESGPKIVELTTNTNTNTNNNNVVKMEKPKKKKTKSQKKKKKSGKKGKKSASTNSNSNSNNLVKRKSQKKKKKKAKKSKKEKVQK